MKQCNFFSGVGHRYARTPHTAHRVIWSAKVFVLMQMLIFCNLSSLGAQCECPEGLVDADFEQTEILPFCDEITINTIVTNTRDSGSECTTDMFLRISIGTSDESNTPLDAIKYLGDLPLAFEDTWFDGMHIWRRFNLSIDDLPDQEFVNNAVRFSLEPDTYYAGDDYLIHVDLIPQEASECSLFPPDNFHIFTFLVTRGLWETPISGQVSDLIAATRLLPNSGVSAAVEQKTIDGLLDVDVDYSFDGPGNSIPATPVLYLFPGTQILVRSGVTLTLLNALIFACDQLAVGITLEPGATLRATSSSINDCRFAIDAKPGSTISLVSNDFFDNYIGLNLDMDGVQEANKRVNILAMTGNRFSTTQAAINAPYSGMPEPVEARGYCGIRLNQYRDFNVFGTTTFDSLANGILGFNSTGNIGNMTFFNMNSIATTPVYQHEGYGIYLASKDADWFNINFPFSTMTFDSCKTGIRAINYAGKVERTAMIRVNTGIDWSNSHTRDVRLRNNTITARHFGIRSGLNEPLHPISVISNNRITISGALAPGNNLTRGIEMNEIGFGYTPSGSSVPVGLEGWDVGNDTISMLQGGIGIGYRNGVLGTVHENIVVNTTQPAVYTGILAEGVMHSDLTANTIDQTAAGLGTSTAIHSSAGFANTYQCNCMDNTDIGLLFLDMAEFTDAVRGNSMNIHCTGLQLNAGAYIGGQYHTGNLWDLEVIEGNCLGGRNYSIVSLSPIFVDENDGSELNPEVWPDEIWFKDESGPTYDNCAACSFPPLTPPRIPESSVPTALDEVIAADELFPDLYEDEMNWKGAFRLYRKMLRHPSIESYATVYEDFKEDHDSLSTGRLAYIAEERSKIFTLTAVEDSTLEYYRQYWHGEMGNLLTLDSLRQAGDTSVLVSQYDTAVLESTAARIQYAEYLDTLVQVRKTKIQTLRMQNAWITATTPTPAANHKTVNNIVFNLLLYDTLQTGDLATLVSIADMCPLEGGDAVYEARTIVAHFTGASYDDVELCAVSEERKRAESAETPANAGKVVLYPNPTTGLLAWSGTNEQPVLLRLYNNTGQLQVEQNLTSTMVQIGHLPEGFYQVQLLDAKDKSVLATQKVLLIKH